MAGSHFAHAGPPQCLARASVVTPIVAALGTLLVCLVPAHYPAERTDVNLAPPMDAYLRVNQVGYSTIQSKSAILMSSGIESGALFHLIRAANGEVAYTGHVAVDLGGWSDRFSHTYQLDFTRVVEPGTYYLQVDG